MEFWSDYLEAVGFVKPYLPDGEINFVVMPDVTEPGFEVETILCIRSA